jgi:hypothetical protein
MDALTPQSKRMALVGGGLILGAAVYFSYKPEKLATQ